MSKKKLLANVLFKHLALVTVPLLGRRGKPALSVLAYHRVREPQGENYPFVDGTISASPEDFERQVRFVTRDYDVMNFRTLHEELNAGRMPERALVMTFDDGYEDNYSVAFDILKTYGATASIYLVTSYIDSNEPFWYDKVAYQIKRTRAAALNLGHGEYRFDLSGADRLSVIDGLQRIFNAVPETVRKTLIDELHDQAAVDVAAEDVGLARPLTWQQVKEMSDWGIEMGSHTVTHPYLRMCTDEQIKMELGESKAQIEAATGRTVVSVAYPAGSYDQRVVESARSCGYAFGLSYAHGVGEFDAMPRFEIPRLHVETDVDYPLFVANLLLPQVFAK